MLTDYNIYIMSRKEKILYTLMAAIVLYFVGFIFYRSHILAVMVGVLGIFYPNMKTKEIIENRKHNLNLQFSDMIYSLSSSLSAGKSVELAFKDVLKDLSIIYPNPNTDIIVETEYIIRKIEMNETVESALLDFAERSHLEDIQNFADVFQICKRTGGNLNDIIRNTSIIINDKMEIKMEIDTILASKKFEQKVLNIIPIFLMLMLSVSSKDYMEPVFNTVFGKVATTFAIVLLAISYFISKKIMDIEI